MLCIDDFQNSTQFYHASVYQHPPTAKPHSAPKKNPQQVYQHTPYGFAAVAAPIVNYPAVSVTTPADDSLEYAVRFPEVFVTRQHSSLSDTASQHSSSHHPSTEHRDSDDDESPLMHSVTVASIQQCRGRVQQMALTAHGSSFLQYALRKFPAEAFAALSSEIFRSISMLLLDKNGCYVVKALCEMMHKDDALPLLQPITCNTELLLALCTKDLHSRRMVQFFLEFEGPKSEAFRRPLYELLMTRPMSIVRTQQGCITTQRILDHCALPAKEAFFRNVRGAFLHYALDPFGHYIVEYMLAEGDQVENSRVLAAFWSGMFPSVACHKNAATIVEKCFGLVTPTLQRQIVDELFGAPEPALIALLRNETANYVIQSAIRSASHRDVAHIHNRIAHLLPLAAFGKKIQARIQRRLAQGQ